MRFSGVCWLSLALLAPALALADAEFGLDALLARMASTRGVALRFVERRDVALLVEPLESRGRLYFVPPERMARFTSEPAFSSLLVEGAALRFRESRDGPEFDLSGSPTARAFVENILAVFSGDRARLERLYRTELRGDSEAWELVLHPRRPPLARFLEAVVLRGDAEGMREMEVRDADGDRTLTRFEAVARDRSFSPAELETLFGDGVPLADVP